MAQVSDRQPSPADLVDTRPDSERKVGRGENPAADLPTSLPLRRLPYTYDELEDGAFRIVKIQPGNRNDPVACDIITHQRVTADQYDALSYTWGDPNDGRHVFPDNGYGYLPVTRNCFNAMRRLRRKDQDRKVWIDAVCINQDSIEERGSQVAIMGSIYENARRVFIYLGEEDFHSNLAMAYLSAIEKREIQFDTPTTPEVLEALILFLARPWFSRIWVLQEVYQAKKAIVLCGTKRVSWDAIQTLRYFENLRESRVKVWPYVTTVKDKKLLKAYQLYVLLTETRGCQATDPRDKLFALLPLLADASNCGLAADYALSKTRIFFKVAQYLAATSGLGFLSDVSCDSSLTENHSLPSWVPDWTIPLNRTPLNQIGSRSFWGAGREGDIEGRWKTACQDFVQWANESPLDFMPVRDLPYVVSQPHLSVPSLAIGEIETILPPANLKEKSWKTILREWDEVAQHMSISPVSFEHRFGGMIDDDEIGVLIPSPPRRPILQALFMELSHPALSTTLYNIFESMQDFTYSDKGLFDREHDVKYDEWVSRVERVIHGRRFFRTKNGFFGVAVGEACEGDSIMILATGPVPYVFRGIDCRHSWLEPTPSVCSLIGDCYLAGVMTGRFVQNVVAQQKPDAPDFIKLLHIC